MFFLDEQAQDAITSPPETFKAFTSECYRQRTTAQSLPLPSIRGMTREIDDSQVHFHEDVLAASTTG